MKIVILKRCPMLVFDVMAVIRNNADKSKICRSYHLLKIDYEHHTHPD